MTGRSVCNDASDCKGVARAVVADQAAMDARKKTRQAKANAANATAGAENNNKRSKKLFHVEARANETDVEARALSDTLDGVVGGVTDTVGDVTDTVGVKTRDGKEVRAAVTDDAAIEDRMKSRQAKSAAANATAEARSVGPEGALAKKQAAANDTADAAAEARKTRKSRKSRRSHQLW